MSRLNSSTEMNPATKTLKWKGEKTKPVGTGKTRTIEVIQEAGWYWWDGEKNNLVEAPFSFLWGESAYSISGYNNDTGKGVFSNEVRNLQEDELTVQSDGKVIIKGLYKEIKETVKGYGGKYTVAVYAIADLGDGFEVIRLLMSGSSFDGWSSLTSIKTMVNGKPKYTKIHGAQEKMVTDYITFYDKREETMKTGATYDVPVFKFMSATKEDQETANEFVRTQIEPWFKYLESKKDNGPKPKEQKEDLPKHPSDEEDDNDDEEYPDAD